MPNEPETDRATTTTTKKKGVDLDLAVVVDTKESGVGVEVIVAVEKGVATAAVEKEVAIVAAVKEEATMVARLTPMKNPPILSHRNGHPRSEKHATSNNNPRTFLPTFMRVHQWLVRWQPGNHPTSLLLLRAHLLLLERKTNLP